MGEKFENKRNREQDKLEAARLTEQVTSKLQSDKEKLTEGISCRTELINGNLFQVITSLMKQTQHEIYIVNDKVDRLNERMNTKLKSCGGSQTEK